MNEKVYTVSLLTIALLTWLTFRWQENLGKGREDNLLVLMAFIMALSVGNHLMALLVLPSLFLFIPRGARAHAPQPAPLREFARGGPPRA